MKKGIVISTLDEDLETLGLKKKKIDTESEKSKEDEVPDTKVEDTKTEDNKTDDSKADSKADTKESNTNADGSDAEIDEGLRIVKKKIGSSVRIARKKARLYYKRNKSKLKRSATKYRKSAQGRHAVKKRKRFLKSFGSNRISAARKAGKRIVMADVNEEISELIEKMYLSLEMVTQEISPLLETDDEVVAEHVDYIIETSSEIEDSLDEIVDVLSEMDEDEFVDEEIEDALFEIADSIYDVLETYVDVMDIEESDDLVSGDDAKSDD